VLTAKTLIFHYSKCTTEYNNLRIFAPDILTVVAMKSTFFWYAMLCSPVNLYWNRCHNIPADSAVN
jgi:hypothetical protein